MIMILSDTHCYYDMVNRQINYAENVLGHEISCVIHLGDFGLFDSWLKDYFIKQKKSFLRPLYFIDGNHEDFMHLPKLVTKYSSYFTYLPRATVHEIEGYRFLALGGAAYMDSMITERGAVITNQQIDQCLAIPRKNVDLIISHDCPTDIGVPNTPGMEHFGPTGFPRSDELALHFKPKKWFFGHHHKWHYHIDGDTEYLGLSGVWKGFGLLDTDYKYTMVSNIIDFDEASIIEKLLMKLKIIRPGAPGKKDKTE